MSHDKGNFNILSDICRLPGTEKRKSMDTDITSVGLLGYACKGQKWRAAV